MSNKTPGPPPTILGTLERMHALCMELEEDIQEIKLMGGFEEHEDEIEVQIQTLTFDIQTAIEENES